ncbi:hypothetical protein BYT27DRAFT_6754524 [Phlegmacium glaucopus]|nr:hypothetical protein BYT27DRAFT_6754524 [Phlegmacium glaucopus]
MFSPFHVLLSIRLGLLLATIDLVLGQGSSEKFDILRGTGGVPACKLQETIVSNCQPSVSEQSVNPGAASNVSSTILNGNDTSPVPSRCSCTTIFFNIWSACCYSNTVNLPNLTTWTLKCANSSNVFYSSTKVSDLPVNLGIEVPPLLFTVHCTNENRRMKI